MEKPSSTDVLLLSRLHQSLIASSKTVASPCRARTLSTELDFGVALTVVGRGRGFGKCSSRRIGDKRLSSLRNSLRKRTRRNGGLLALRRVCNQMLRKFLRVLGRKWGLTRGVDIFIVRNLVVGLDAFSGACSENFPKAVAIVPVTTFDGLAASLASLIILAYLAKNLSHLLAPVALERKRLGSISKLLGRLNLRLTGPETVNKPVDIGKSFSLLGI